MTADPPVAAAAPVIDSHHHFWRVARQHQAWRTAEHHAIERDYDPADLRAELAAAGVDATVLVQSVDTEEENDRLAAYATRAADYVAAVVGWLPLAAPDAARAELARFTHPLLRGVRTLVARDPLDWLTAPGSLALFRDLADRGLTWDVVPLTPEQVRNITALAEAVPGLRIVVDHLARPPVETGERAPWAARLAALAAQPGVALKVSVGIDVLTAWPRWDADALLPYVAHAVEVFGPERLMLASNWPVVLLRRDYGGALADLTAVLSRAGVGKDGLAQIRGATAARWYGVQT
ncbi:amidohydrolase family protein [Streptomyces johnsoniae]|uniref:Amidohydrolase family protein n=1 Tax=Streptomyces johnsoniae TaxID=3075532 RepID=A0ABU2SDD2_9ACTN|nr:amidohydrolase family protein [Streptomyces sp. DSM 41886]MDT0446982.1 amidohydrolase family protein [Streptomyces sp. DSM 41886]